MIRNLFILPMAFFIANVSAQNVKPSAKPDTLTMYQGGSGMIDLTANDYDANGDVITVTSYKISTTPVANTKVTLVKGIGYFSVINNKYLNYTPDSVVTFIGDYTSLSYIANDGKTGAGKAGKIVIRLLPIPRDPNLKSFSSSAFVIFETRNDSCKKDGVYQVTIKVVDNTKYGNTTTIETIAKGSVLHTVWNNKAQFILFDNRTPGVTKTIELTEADYFLIGKLGCTR